MSDWRPIKTAPKDGRLILAWFNTEWVESIYVWGDSWGFGCDGEQSKTEPKYWMPIPEQPEDKGDG